MIFVLSIFPRGSGEFEIRVFFENYLHVRPIGHFKLYHFSGETFGVSLRVTLLLKYVSSKVVKSTQMCFWSAGYFSFSLKTETLS